MVALSPFVVAYLFRPLVGAGSYHLPNIGGFLALRRLENKSMAIFGKKWITPFWR